MNVFYREKDKTLYREYTLLSDTKPVHFQTKRATVDIVETNEYASMFFIDNVLQCSIVDEYIYHEFLVHIPMAYAQSHQSVCILGGGDGCAAREVLKWKDVDRIDLYDWDEQLVEYFRHHGKLWNQGSLKNPKVVHQPYDVSTLFQTPNKELYDVILVDLLDPEFCDLQPNGFWFHLLQMVCQWRKPGGSVVINAGGIAPWQIECFSILKKLCQQLFPDLYCIPYKVFVPSFGREWGFLMMVEKNSQCRGFPSILRRVNEKTFRNSYLWEPDYKIEG